jgi:hypothetical protein
LLGLLDPQFTALSEITGNAYTKLRERLAAHYVQRRRVDIEAWKEPGIFPQVGDCADAGSVTLITAAFVRTSERIRKRIEVSCLHTGHKGRAWRPSPQARTRAAIRMLTRASRLLSVDEMSPAAGTCAANRPEGLRHVPLAAL